MKVQKSVRCWTECHIADPFLAPKDRIILAAISSEMSSANGNAIAVSSKYFSLTYGTIGSVCNFFFSKVLIRLYLCCNFLLLNLFSDYWNNFHICYHSISVECTINLFREINEIKTKLFGSCLKNDNVVCYNQTQHLKFNKSLLLP